MDLRRVVLNGVFERVDHFNVTDTYALTSSDYTASPTPDAVLQTLSTVGSGTKKTVKPLLITGVVLTVCVRVRLPLSW